jgi:hypothetical protein
MRRHLRRVVIQNSPHHLLWNIAVDEPSPEGVTPLMRGETDGITVLVADVAAFSYKPNWEIPEMRKFTNSDPNPRVGR